MSGHYDVIVAGLGAMGSAALFHLARQGARVLGLDRFLPPHSFGSSHGRTRIIREAYFEHPSYVPLVGRAYELWHRLEAEAETPLFLQTGGLMIGPREGSVFLGAKLSAETHGLEHQILGGAEMRHRYPAFHLEPDMGAVWEPRAGVLFPEKCIAAHLRLAQRSGAQLRLEEPLTAWEPDGDGVSVVTGGDKFHADRLVLSTGAWMPGLLADLNVPWRVERQVMFWFEAAGRPGLFKPGQFPVYICEHQPGRYIYGFPDSGDGIKVARHHEGETTRPDTISREIKAEDVAGMRDILERILPEANGPVLEATVCLYTDTPDGHFILDRHPEVPGVILASPCSGHGFKFSSAIGEVLAGFAIGRPSPLDLGLFRLGRFL